MLVTGAVGQQSAQPVVPAATPAHPGVDASAPEDPKEIIRRAMDVDQRNFTLARNYTYQEKRNTRAFDKHGSTKHQQSETYDFTILYDEPYSRLIQKNDKPLSEKDEKKEQEKLDKFIAKHKNESEKEKQKRLAKMEKDRREERAFAGDIINAYNFRMAGQEQVDGRDVYVIEANPRKDFHPTQPHADVLPKLHGKVWIDKKDYDWVKIEAESIGTISWGLFLARIHKGSRFTFEQTRVNDEIWLPRRISINASARFALLLSGAFDFESSYSNYKKFVASGRVLPGVTEVEPAKK
jgi:hypothetical protein